MPTTENVAAVRHFWDGFNARNLDSRDEVCAPEFIRQRFGKVSNIGQQSITNWCTIKS